MLDREIFKIRKIAIGIILMQIFFILVFFSCSPKPIRSALSSDTITTNTLALIRKKDVKGLDIPVSSSITIRSADRSVDINLTRVNEDQYLIEQAEKTVKINETSFVPTNTKYVDKSRSKVKKVTKINDNDRIKTKTITKNKKKTLFPWWILIVAAIGIIGFKTVKRYLKL